MLQINLQQIIDDINKRRNHVRYQFQEIALMLAEKLQDPKHKSLYMKLAKNEEQELLMDAMNYVLASSHVSGNLGALFMWKLKELKATPIEPVKLRFEVEGGYFHAGNIGMITRGDMPLAAAGLTSYLENYPNEVVFESRVDEVVLKDNAMKAIIMTPGNPFPSLQQVLQTLFKEFDRTLVITLFKTWRFNGIWGHAFVSDPIILKGVLKLGTPVLTRKPFRSRIHSS